MRTFENIWFSDAIKGYRNGILVKSWLIKLNAKVCKLIFSNSSIGALY